MNTVRIALKSGGSTLVDAPWVGKHFAVLDDGSITHVKSGLSLPLPKDIDACIWEEAIIPFGIEVARLLEDTEELIEILDSSEFGMSAKLPRRASELFNMAVWATVTMAMSKTFAPKQ